MNETRNSSFTVKQLDVMIRDFIVTQPRDVFDDHVSSRAMAEEVLSKFKDHVAQTCALRDAAEFLRKHGMTVQDPKGRLLDQ